MVSLPVFNRSGDKVGDYEIDPAELAPQINKQLLHDAVVMYQANLRQGSFGSKSRGQVRGSTKKMYRQKGTGNARAGSRRSGVRRGGGHIFAKRPRDFSYRLNKKALRTATRMAIASKIQSEAVVVVDDLSFGQPQTKEMFSILKALGISGGSALVATESYDANVYKSARNIARVEVAPVSDLNALSVLRPAKLLITKSALDAVKRRFSGEASSGEASSGEAAE